MKKLLSIIILFTLISCSSKVDYSPRKINFDRDICATCLMGIAEPNYAVQAINKNGKVIWFDDLGCYVEYLKDPAWEKFSQGQKPKVWIADADTGEWLDIEKAYFRYGDRTPMGYGYGAVKTKKDGYFDLETTIKRIKEGKTNRESFIKKHKMMKHGSKNEIDSQNSKTEHNGGMKCSPGKCGGAN